MAQLSSPGVSVTVIDESFYTPAAPGTVPLIIVASEESKQNGAGTGTAPGTLKANAGQVYLMTSQKDLSDTFGTPIFKTDANNNPIHAGEQNEYGLQAAYSLLGVSNRAYVVRADLDLAQLDASATAPAGDPNNGDYWFDVSNTKFGVFQWNGAPATSGGQTFTVQYPTVITDPNKLDGNYAPKASVGAIGDYAISAYTNLVKLWYKKAQTNTAAGTWVAVGSQAWVASWPTAQGTDTISESLSVVGKTFTLNGEAITGATTVAGLVTKINTGGLNGAPLVAGITAQLVNSKLELYSEGGVNGDLNITLTGDGWADVKLSAKTYYVPALQISKHTQVPQWKTVGTGQVVRPTGSVWVKTTYPNLGADWIVKQYNSATGSWVIKSAPLYQDSLAALAGLDVSGGGANLSADTLFVKYNDFEVAPQEADFKIYRRRSGTTTDIVSKIFAAGTVTGEVTLSIVESLKGTAVPSVAKTVTFTAQGNAADAGRLAEAVNIAGFVNLVASVDSANRVVISHKLGGDFQIVDSGVALFTAMFEVSSNTVLNNLRADPSGAARTYVASLWTSVQEDKPAAGFAPASADAPTTVTADGRLWYNSIVDEVDILVHNGTTWVGYKHTTSPYYTAVAAEQTDPNGPIVSATKPTKQSDGSPLVTGDLWISTADLESFPTVYKYDNNLTNLPAVNRWVLVDTSDQTTEDGILFADARWTAEGNNATEDASSIQDLLTSNFLDFDAPDPALYPRGMLLWNLRRSGFNVKRFVRDYVDVNARNLRYGAGEGESQALYYPHRWVTESGNQENGAGTFGRKAQRKVVVQKLQALVNANQQIRDEESRVFNLIACPGYPELVGEMVSLNYDRGLTAFVVGDTPARLTPDATSLSNWGNNQAGALEDNDNGLVSSDEYLGFFYPWGYTSDNVGNNIVVPPSHMMLRTIALSDNVSYPWFAPAGTRRGGITNATSVGYITSEGEFQSVALNNGQRDTLASIKVNPITFITGTGLVNYGQYTRAKNASALDRINVARSVIYLRRQFAQLAKPYVFEPNDKITRDEIKGAAESLLLELVGQRALYDYLVVCDESNNTPARIDRNELYLDVAIEPVKAVEFIYIPLRLKNTGEIKGLA